MDQVMNLLHQIQVVELRHLWFHWWLMWYQLDHWFQ
jgi:hypothetical protein